MEGFCEEDAVSAPTEEEEEVGPPEILLIVHPELGANVKLRFDRSYSMCKDNQVGGPRGPCARMHPPGQSTVPHPAW